MKKRTGIVGVIFNVYLFVSLALLVAYIIYRIDTFEEYYALEKGIMMDEYAPEPSPVYDDEIAESQIVEEEPPFQATIEEEVAICPGLEESAPCEEETPCYGDFSNQNLCDYPPEAKSTVRETLLARGNFYLARYKAKKAICHFEQLVGCYPCNAEYYFLYGQALSWTYEIGDAECALRTSLLLDPNLKNAEIQLGNVFIAQRQYAKARAAFEKYPEDLYARLGLAWIDFSQNRFQEAKAAFCELLEENPGNAEASFGLGMTLARLNRYRQSETLLVQAAQQKPYLHYIPEQIFEVRKQTKPTFEFFSEFRIADDHTRNDPTVLDRYKIFNNHVFLKFPVTDKYRIGFRGFFGFERYKRLAPPESELFLVDIGGAELHNEIRLAPQWELDIWGRFKKAVREATTSFPFESTSRFEPGASLTYDSPVHYLDFRNYFDSFIILNFSRTVSELLARNHTKGTYEYRFPFYTRGVIGSETRYTLYDDDLKNTEFVQLPYVRLGIPKLSEYFTVGYSFRYAAFDQVAQNYYSFDWEKQHVVSIEFHPQWESRTKLFMLYSHGWVDVKNLQLALPGGGPLVPRARYTTELVRGILRHRIEERSFVELSGSYYWTTFPYEEMAVFARLIFLF